MSTGTLFNCLAIMTSPDMTGSAYKLRCLALKVDIYNRMLAVQRKAIAAVWPPGPVPCLITGGGGAKLRNYRPVALCKQKLFLGVTLGLRLGRA